MHNQFNAAFEQDGEWYIGYCLEVPGANGQDVDGILGAVEAGEIETVYLLGADEVDTPRLENAFVIYQGSHGDRGAHAADVILPGAAYTEKSATFVNTEGRPQLTKRAVFPPGDAREDWTILRALSAELGRTLPFDNLAELRKAMYETAPQLASLDQLEGGDFTALRGFANRAIRVRGDAFAPSVPDFYMTNPIARSSAIMAELSALKQEEDRKAAQKGATGTDG